MGPVLGDYRVQADENGRWRNRTVILPVLLACSAEVCGRVKMGM
jgi:hypothetical protein